MSSTLLKCFRSGVLVAFLVAGCGSGEPIPVNLETAAGPCEYGQQLMTEGMMMVMRDGHVTAVPREEGEVQALYAKYKGNPTLDSGCVGCH